MHWILAPPDMGVGIGCRCGVFVWYGRGLGSWPGLMLERDAGFERIGVFGGPVEVAGQLQLMDGSSICLCWRRPAHPYDGVFEMNEIRIRTRSKCVRA